MKFNKKLIEKLRDGKIALDAELNAQYVSEILEETGLPLNNDFAYRYYYRNAFGRIVNNYNPCDLPVIPVSDVLLPEPKFKEGDRVNVMNFGNPKWATGVITEVGTGDSDYEIATEPNGCQLWSKGKDLTLVPEPEYIIGKQYEFSDLVGAWKKGVLLAIIDHSDKYISDVTGTPEGFCRIREIQPKEVTIERWTNFFPDGSVSSIIYESESIARSNTSCGTPILLTGKITI